MLVAYDDDVLRARNGAEAVVVAATHDGPIPLRVTDVVRSQMNRFDHAEELSAGSDPHGCPVQVQTLLATLHDELSLARRATPGMRG